MYQATVSRPPEALAALAEAVRDALPQLDATAVRVATAIFRELAHGEPVSDADVARAAAVPADDVAALLASWPGVFRNEDGQIVGFWGLTVLHMPPHRYTVNGTRLSTWCAYDTLYISHILERAARVETRDALTGETLSFTVSSDGLINLSHPAIVMSFLDPAGKFNAHVIMGFCHFVHFFGQRENGERWAAEHAGTFLLDLPAAFALSKRHVELFRAAGAPAGAGR